MQESQLSKIEHVKASDNSTLFEHLLFLPQHSEISLSLTVKHISFLPLTKELVGNILQEQTKKMMGNIGCARLKIVIESIDQYAGHINLTLHQITPELFHLFWMAISFGGT